MGPAPAILEVEGLTVAFAGKPAVDDVSLVVPRRQAAGIIGETGSGKSTLARSLLDLLPRGSATMSFSKLTFDGQALSRADIRSLRGRKIAMIFQDPLSYLDPVMRIDAQIGEAIRLHDPSAEVGRRVAELLDLVRLPTARKSAYAHQLSGGQRQRVLIAIAIACRPKLLIADEPTTALDVTTQQQILELLKNLQSTLDMSILIVSHDLSVIGAVCDHVYVMRKGRILESGETGSVFARPKHPYTAALLEADRFARDEAGRFKVFVDRDASE